jgi:hypothetical protein
MNWTGGRLSRHSRNAACGLTQQQKQYFAKKRNNATSGSLKRSPLKWAVRAEIEESSHPNHHPRITHVGAHRKHSQRKGQSENQQQEKIENKAVCQSPDGKLAGYPRPLRYREDKLHEYDIYNASPHPQPPPARRKRGPSSSQTRDSCLVEEIGSVDVRKTKILEKNDWTGLSIQRPMQLRYESAGNDKRVGKRRRILGSQVKQHGALAQRRVASPFAGPRKLQSMTTSHAVRQNPNPSMYAEWAVEPRDEVRISIGGKPAHTKARFHLPGRVTPMDSLQQSEDCPSDVILLDEDGLSGGDPLTLSQAHLESKFSTLEELRAIARSWRYRSVSRTTGSHNYVVPHCRRASSSRRADILIEKGISLELLGRQYDFSSRMSDDIITSEAPALMGCEDNIHKFRNHFPTTMLSPGPLQYLCSGHPYEPGLEPVCDGRVTLETTLSLHRENSARSSSQLSYTSNVNSQAFKHTHAVLQDGSRMLIVRSSPRKLYHPRPQPSRSKILDSDSLVADSTAAQLGVAHPFIPPSQALDQEAREAWIKFPNDANTEEPTGFRGHENDPHSISISPGISTFAHHALRHNRHLSLDIRPKPGTSQEGSERGETEEQEQAHSHSEGEVIEEPRISSIGQKGMFAKELDLIIPAADCRNSFLSRPKAEISEPVDKKNDEEKAWKKFIFTSDDESEVETAVTPQPKITHLLSKTSSEVEVISKRPSEIPRPIPNPPSQSTPNSSLKVHLSAETIIATQPTLSSSGRVTRHVTPSQFASGVLKPDCCTSNNATFGTNASLSSPRRFLPTRAPSYRKMRKRRSGRGE